MSSVIHTNSLRLRMRDDDTKLTGGAVSLWQSGTKVADLPADSGINWQYNFPAAIINGTYDLYLNDVPVVNNGNQVRVIVVRDGVIVRANVSPGAIGTTEIASDTINNDRLKDDAVQERNIQANAVTNPKMANNSISQGKMQDNSAPNRVLTDDSVGTDELQNASVTNPILATDSVSRSKMQNGSVNDEKMADGGVTTPKLANKGVTTEKLATAAVTDVELATDAVRNGKIFAKAVTNEKIDDDAIDSRTLAPGAVDKAAMGNNAVGTAAIEIGAVTTEKIEDDGVDSAKLAPEAVDTPAIATAAVTKPKMAVDSVGTSQMEALSVTEPKHAAGGVSTRALADRSVESLKIALLAILTEHIGDDQVGLSKLTQAARDYIDAAGGGTITNNPDDDTLESFDDGGTNKLRLKNLGIRLDHLSTTLRNELASRAVIYVAANDSSADHKLRAASFTCNGVNDEVTMLAAIDSLPGGSGTVEILPGNYSVSFTEKLACLVIKNKFRLHLNFHKGAVITKPNGTDGTAIKLWQCSDTVVTHPQIDGNRAGAALKGGIWVNDCDRIIIDAPDIVECDTHGIGIYSSRQVLVNAPNCRDGNAAHMIDVDRDVTEFPDKPSEDLIFNGGYSGNSQLDAFKVENCRNVLISDMILEGVSGKNVAVAEMNDAPGPATVLENIYFNNCQFKNGDRIIVGSRSGYIGFHGGGYEQGQIYIGGTGGDVSITAGFRLNMRATNTAIQVNPTVTDKSHILIHGAMIKGADAGTESKLIGYDAPGGRVTISSCKIYNFRNAGIQATAQCPGMRILDNTILPAGVDNGWAGNNIGIDLLNAGNTVRGNDIESAKTGIRLQSSTDNEIHFNKLHGDVSGYSGPLGIQETGTASANRIFFNNIAGPAAASRIVLAANSTTELHRNKGYKTTDSGSDSIHDLDTNVDITVNIDRDLTAEDVERIEIRPASALHSSSFPYPTLVDTTTFRINCTQGPGAGLTVNYNWSLRDAG